MPRRKPRGGETEQQRAADNPDEPRARVGVEPCDIGIVLPQRRLLQRLQVVEQREDVLANRPHVPPQHRRRAGGVGRQIVGEHELQRGPELGQLRLQLGPFVAFGRRLRLRDVLGDAAFGFLAKDSAVDRGRSRARTSSASMSASRTLIDPSRTLRRISDTASAARA